MWGSARGVSGYAQEMPSCAQRAAAPWGWYMGAWRCRQSLVSRSPGGAPSHSSGGPRAGTKPGGARAGLAWRVGFPAVLVMNLHEPSVSTRRQSMAESTGVNKCLYNEGRGERAPPRRPPLLGPGGQRLINAEWHSWPPPPPPRLPPLSPATLCRGVLRGLRHHQCQ